MSKFVLLYFSVFFLFGELFFGFSFVYAKDIKILVKEIRLDTDNKQQAQAKAINELSRELVKNMIGKDRYKQSEQSIENSIIAKQNRYILSTSSSPSVLQDDGSFSFQVTLKFSRSNLKNLLLKHNLFYVSEGSFCVLPLISFMSHLKDEPQSYSWWLKSDNESPVPFLHAMAKSFFNILSGEFIKVGFYTLDPVFQRMYEGTPFKVLPKRNDRLKNFIPLAQFYNCDIVLAGYVKVSHFLAPFSKDRDSLSFLGSQNKENSLGKPSNSKDSHPLFVEEKGKSVIQVFFNVFNIKTRQFLFRFKKQFSYISQNLNSNENSSHFKNILISLTSQLSFFQKEGSLDLYRLNMSIQGPLTYAEKKQLKRLLLQKILSIQSLEERFLTSNRVVFFAETSQDAASIAKKLREVSLTHFIIQVKGYKDKELEIYARKR